MFLKYGTYTHAQDECEVKIAKKKLTDQYGNVLGWKEDWDIRGLLSGTSVSDLNTKMAALETAYAYNFQDLLLLDNSSNVTQNVMYNANSYNGIRITDLNYPEGKGGEYTTYRTYTIKAEAQFGSDRIVKGGVLDFNQTIAWTGTGGEKFVVKETRFGQPIKQRVARQTAIRVSQSGDSSGFDSYPTPPQPIYPNDIHEEQTQVTKYDPATKGESSRKEFKISWSYSMTLIG